MPITFTNIPHLSIILKLLSLSSVYTNCINSFHTYVYIVPKLCKHNLNQINNHQSISLSHVHTQIAHTIAITNSSHKLYTLYRQHIRTRHAYPTFPLSTLHNFLNQPISTTQSQLHSKFPQFPSNSSCIK